MPSFSHPSGCTEILLMTDCEYVRLVPLPLPFLTPLDVLNCDYGFVQLLVTRHSLV